MEIISHGSNSQQPDMKTTCPYCGCTFRFNLSREARYMRWAPSDNDYFKDKAAYKLGYEYFVRCPDCKDTFYVTANGASMSENSYEVLREQDTAIQRYNDYLDEKFK